MSNQPPPSGLMRQTSNLTVIDDRAEMYRIARHECACRINLPASGTARNLLSEWLRTNPVHTRKEHLLAKDIFKWFDRRLNGRRSKCSR